MSMDSLICAAYAAGFAMAPSEDETTYATIPQPEIALRNGHALAARRKHHTFAGVDLSALANPSRLIGARETVYGWLGGGRATA